MLSTTAANVGQPADCSAALGGGSTELLPEASMVPEPGPEDQQQQEGGAKKQPSYVRWHVIKVPSPAVPQLVTVAAAETGSAWCFRHACAKVANVSLIPSISRCGRPRGTAASRRPAQSRLA